MAGVSSLSRRVKLGAPDIMLMTIARTYQGKSKGCIDSFRQLSSHESPRTHHHFLHAASRFLSTAKCLRASHLIVTSNLVAFGFDLTTEPGASLLPLCAGKHFEQYKEMPQIFFALSSNLEEETIEPSEITTNKLTRIDPQAERQYSMSCQIKMLKQLKAWFAYDGKFGVREGTDHAEALWEAYREAREKGTAQKKERGEEYSLPKGSKVGTPSLSAGSISSCISQNSETYVVDPTLSTELLPNAI